MSPSTITAPRLAGALEEVRFHGRGGQGTVVASKILSVAAFLEGRHVQSFPTFGVERRGAPVAAFVRVDRDPIRVRCAVREPSHVVIVDPTLLDAVDVTQGLKEGGTILVNAAEDMEERHPPSPSAGAGFGVFHWCVRHRPFRVDATAIAVRHGLGTRAMPIVNTAILGAVAKVTGLVTLDSVCEAIRRSGVPHTERNIEAAREAYEGVRGVTIQHPPCDECS